MPQIGYVHNAIFEKQKGRIYTIGGLKLPELGISNGIGVFEACVYLVIAIPWALLLNIFISPGWFHGLGWLFMLAPPFYASYLFLQGTTKTGIAYSTQQQFNLKHALIESRNYAAGRPFRPTTEKITVEIITPRPLDFDRH